MHVPVLIAWFLWGLVIGGIMWVAFRLSGDHPERRVAISAVAVLIGSGGMWWASSEMFAPPHRLGPTIASGRIEQPADGFAVTFPLDWEVQQVSAGGNEYLLDDDTLLRSALAATSTDGICTVSDFTALAEAPPAWTSLEDAIAPETSYAEGMDEIASVDTTFMVLPAGRTGCIDVVDTDGWESRGYYYKHGEAWFLLSCGAENPPDDRWLTIAETFEFLPKV